MVGSEKALKKRGKLKGMVWDHRKLNRAKRLTYKRGTIKKAAGEITNTLIEVKSCSTDCAFKLIDD